MGLPLEPFKELGLQLSAAVIVCAALCFWMMAGGAILNLIEKTKEVLP